MVDLTSIRFLLDLKDIEAFYGSEDIEQEIQIINDNLFQNHSMTSQELNILKDFIFLLYKDCKKVHLSPNQTYSFINIVQQCFQYIMNLKYSEEIESNAISIFQSLVRL